MKGPYLHSFHIYVQQNSLVCTNWIESPGDGLWWNFLKCTSGLIVKSFPQIYLDLNHEYTGLLALALAVIQLDNILLCI